jgi:hypothetical protein
MLTGAILEGCMAIADSDDQTRAREDAGDILAALLEGLRPHNSADDEEVPGTAEKVLAEKTQAEEVQAEKVPGTQAKRADRTTMQATAPLAGGR